MFLSEWLFAKVYDRLIRNAEDKGLKDWRRALLKNASGEVLELGCGTGANLEFYDNTVTRLVLTEPSRFMQRKIKSKLSACKVQNVEIRDDQAEHLSFLESSFDVVVCTLVLCSVQNLEKALAEIYRVLKPRGKLIFIEHVAAENNTKRNRWQHRIEPLWKRIAAGCHLTRKTEKAIGDAGFNVIEIARQSMRGIPGVARPSIRGVAVKKTLNHKVPNGDCLSHGESKNLVSNYLIIF